jgi:hypothetical protein
MQELRSQLLSSLNDWRQRVSALECELAKYKDNDPEAVEAMSRWTGGGHDSWMQGAQHSTATGEPGMLQGVQSPCASITLPPCLYAGQGTEVAKSAANRWLGGWV